MLRDGGVFRENPVRLLEMGNGEIGPVLPEINPAEAVDDVAVFGFQLQGFPDESLRFVEPDPPVRQTVADKVERLGVIRFHIEDPLHFQDALFEASRLFIENTEPVAHLQIPRIVLQPAE